MKPTVLPETFLRYMTKESRTPMGKAGRTQPEIDEANAIKCERELHRLAIQYLNMREVMFNHDRMDKPRTGRPGWPDFEWCQAGHAVYVECKAPGKGLDPDQVIVHEALLKDGATCIVAYSLEQFKNLLEG